MSRQDDVTFRRIRGRVVPIRKRKGSSRRAQRHSSEKIGRNLSLGILTTVVGGGTYGALSEIASTEKRKAYLMKDVLDYQYSRPGIQKKHINKTKRLKKRYLQKSKSLKRVANVGGVGLATFGVGLTVDSLAKAYERNTGRDIKDINENLLIAGGTIGGAAGTRALAATPWGRKYGKKLFKKIAKGMGSK